MIHPFPNTFVFSLPNTLGNYFHSLFLQFDPCKFHIKWDIHSSLFCAVLVSLNAMSSGLCTTWQWQHFLPCERLNVPFPCSHILGLVFLSNHPRVGCRLSPCLGCYEKLCSDYGDVDPDGTCSSLCWLCSRCLSVPLQLGEKNRSQRITVAEHQCSWAIALEYKSQVQLFAIILLKPLTWIPSCPMRLLSDSQKTKLLGAKAWPLRASPFCP